MGTESVKGPRVLGDILYFPQALLVGRKGKHVLRRETSW